MIFHNSSVGAACAFVKIKKLSCTGLRQRCTLNVGRRSSADRSIAVFSPRQGGVCVCVWVCVCVCHPCNKGLSNLIVRCRGMQHLWHTARSEAIAKGGKGSRRLDPVPAKSCSWVTEWQLGNSTNSRRSKTAHQ